MMSGRGSRSRIEARRRRIVVSKAATTAVACATLDEHLGTVAGDRRAKVSPALPAILARLGRPESLGCLCGVLHSSLLKKDLMTWNAAFDAVLRIARHHPW